MKLRIGWLCRRRGIDPAAVAAVDDAQRRLDEADAQLAKAQQVGAAGKRYGEVNGFAERWEAALGIRGARP